MRQTTKYLTSLEALPPVPSRWTGLNIERLKLMRKLIVPIVGITGLVSAGVSTAAHAAPICATTASQIENSSSQLLKDMLKPIHFVWRGIGRP